MIIPTKDRITIYTRLFEDGVMVPRKDYNGKHHYLDMKNIWVWHAMRSLVSRGHVKHQFSWQWNYYMLTNEGIEYLRSYLHLPDDIVPNTLKKTRAGDQERERDPRREERGDRGERGERGPRPGGRGRGGFDRERRDGGREGGAGRGFGGDKKMGAPRAGDIGFKK